MLWLFVPANPPNGLEESDCINNSYNGGHTMNGVDYQSDAIRLARYKSDRRKSLALKGLGGVVTLSL